MPAPAPQHADGSVFVRVTALSNHVCLGGVVLRPDVFKLVDDALAQRLGAELACKQERAVVWHAARPPKCFAISRSAMAMELEL